MKSLICKTICNVSSLSEAEKNLISLFAEIRKTEERIGYVAGIINSDGQEFVKTNIEKLDKFTDVIRGNNNFPIFSSIDICLHAKLWDKIQPVTEATWLKFWQNILNNGYVTDIFMTPRWEKSVGATDEFNTAKRHGLKIHYVPLAQ